MGESLYSILHFREGLTYEKVDLGENKKTAIEREIILRKLRKEHLGPNLIRGGCLALIVLWTFYMMMEGNMNNIQANQPHYFDYIYHKTFYYFDHPYFALLLHSLNGTVFLLSAFYQIFSSSFFENPLLHRRIGYACLFTSSFVSTASLVLSVKALYNTAPMYVFAAFLWVMFTFMTWFTVW